MKSKIIKELPDLVKHKVISEEIALKIRNYYDSKPTATTNHLFTIFGVLGSLLVGLGIILILAHNWDHFSRPLKTCFAFLPLIIGQIIVAYTILKKKNNTWKETAGLFLFLTIGSSIAMVSQIYNIPGNLNTYVLTWILLGMPLIYLLDSHSVALLHISFSTFYVLHFGYKYNSGINESWIYILLMVWMLPFYLKLLKYQPEGNLTSLYNWLFPLSFTLTLGTFFKSNDDLVYLSYMSLFGVFYGLGKLSILDNRKLRQNGYLIIGSLGIIIMLLLTSYNWRWDYNIDGMHLVEVYLTLFLIICNVLLLVFLHLKQRLQRFNMFHYIFLIYAILFFIGSSYNIAITILINILVLMLGVITIKIGTEQHHFGILNYGLVIITALIVCRFFDTDMSYVVRGLLFVCVGLGFFITNNIMAKRKRAIRELES